MRQLFPFIAVACLACAEQPLPTTPPLLSGRSAPHDNLAPFVEAQGTWCDRNEPGHCDGIDQDGIGWVNAFWDGTSPIGVVDPGGVNARWYAAHWQPDWPTVLPFAAAGTVHDELMPDGRRHLRARLRVENTFLALYDESFNIVLGADFAEYGIEAPVTASMDFDYEAYLPAGFAGMPDLVQPEAWEGVVRLDATLRATGRLRGELRGIPAGTLVDLVWRQREFPRGGGRSQKPNFGYRLSLRDGESGLTVSRRR